jgi:hypothetical protein
VGWGGVGGAPLVPISTWRGAPLGAPSAVRTIAGANLRSKALHFLRYLRALSSLAHPCLLCCLAVSLSSVAQRAGRQLYRSAFNRALPEPGDGGVVELLPGLRFANPLDMRIKVRSMRGCVMVECDLKVE